MRTSGPARRAALLFAALAWARMSQAAEPLILSPAGPKGAALRLYGFLETDLITDSRQGFSESQANSLVPKATSFAGAHRRLQMSVRQTRAGLDLTLPESDGWKANAVLELDFYGNNAPNTQPGAAAGLQSEKDFFNNPAPRIRLAYLNASKGRWNIKAGQNWSLFGWQTEYFPPEVTVQATVGQLNCRTAQLRGTYTLPLSPSWRLEAAAELARPAEMNSGAPVYHGGLRLADSERKVAVKSGYTDKLKDLSAAFSYAVTPMASAGRGAPTATAWALDLTLPLIKSYDGKDKAGNLALIGEYVRGGGVGGVELPLLSFGVPAPTLAAAGTAIDAGVAGINAAADIEPIRFWSGRAALAYTLPDPRWSVGGGYAEVRPTNLGDFGSGAAALGFATKLQYGFISLIYDPIDWLRLAGQVSRTKDTYSDAANPSAANNRLQLSSFVLF